MGKGLVSPHFPQQPPSQHPTLGVHPDKSEWFHCTRIHTIVDERLGIYYVEYPNSSPFLKFMLHT